MPFKTKNLHTPAAKKRAAKAALTGRGDTAAGVDARRQLPPMYQMVTLAQVGAMVCPHKPAVARTVRDWIVLGAGPRGYKVNLRCTVTPRMGRVCSMDDVITFMDDLRDAYQRFSHDLAQLKGGELDKYRARALAQKMVGGENSTTTHTAAGTIKPAAVYPPLHNRYQNLKRGGQQMPGAKRQGRPEASRTTAQG